MGGRQLTFTITFTIPITITGEDPTHAINPCVRGHSLDLHHHSHHRVLHQPHCLPARRQAPYNHRDHQRPLLLWSRSFRGWEILWRRAGLR